MTLRTALVILLAALAPAKLSAGYVVENVSLPPELRGGIAAVAFTPGGSAVVATRLGEIWLRRSGEPAAWRRFAGGLDEPMGLIAESESVILAAHRPEVLRMTDSDGDGRADKSTVFADGLYIPTGLELANGGCYVGQSPDLLFLKDTNGDDVVLVKVEVTHIFVVLHVNQTGDRITIKRTATHLSYFKASGLSVRC